MAHMQSPDPKKVTGTFLLRLARGSIEHGLEHGEPLPVDLDELSEELAEPAATFTTLRRKGELRGCCGMLEAVRPLATDVAHSAYRAAFHDSRFKTLRRDELEGVRLEVSVLSPLEPMQVGSEADLVEKLRPGIDGLVIVEGVRRATFLPKVWDMLPEPQRFLAQLKSKCDLPRDYWSERLEFLRYSTTTYSDPA
jgi:AmmeMemoRadiSam system protein A